MSIVWQQRISHFDRPVKRSRMRSLGIRLSALKQDVREKRGYPSNGHSSEYTFARLRCQVAKRRGKDVAAIEARLEFMRLRERMLSKKQQEKRITKRRRRPSVSDTGINLAKRRREFIAQHDAMRASQGEMFSTGAQDTGTRAIDA